MRRPLIVALIGLAALPATGQAATLTANANDHLFAFRGASGELNRVKVERTGDGFTLVDSGATAITLTASGSADCTQTASNAVHCDATADSLVKVQLGDGDDRATADGAVGVKLSGDEGDDVLTGGDGADDLDGGTGDDTLRGNGGADDLDGGDGVDTADYGAALEAVTVTADGLAADDGALGEGDDVGSDVETLVGGTAGDKLTATAAGGTLKGGAGADTLTGGPGPDAFSGGDGDDRLSTGDAFGEPVACGAGADSVTADDLDQLDGDCERPAVRETTDATPAGEKGDSPAEEGDTAAAPLTENPAPILAGLPRPAVGRTLNVAPAAGTVLVTRPGGRPQRLGDDATIPVGALIDARQGAITLTAAADDRGNVQTATFEAGSFRIRQVRGTRPVTELVLAGGNFASCPRSSGAKARSAAGKKPGRKLWGRGKGRFRTRGKNSSATVRGTWWLVEDSCSGTQTKVREGSVWVRDNKRRMKVVIKRGQTYRTWAPKRRR